MRAVSSFCRIHNLQGLHTIDFLQNRLDVLSVFFSNKVEGGYNILCKNIFQGKFFRICVKGMVHISYLM